jgi:MinD-like ATPase involved in chromosome partitioning or flagellar assembly
LKQSEQTEDAVLRVELVRAALRTALKGLEYLPGDEELATVADLSERRLSFVSGPAGKQGSTAY